MDFQVAVLLLIGLELIFSGHIILGLLLMSFVISDLGDQMGGRL